MQPRCPASACCFCVPLEHVLWLFLQVQVPACPGLVVDCTHVVFRLPACGKFGECWHHGMSKRSIKGTCGWVLIVLVMLQLWLCSPLSQHAISYHAYWMCRPAHCVMFLPALASTDACALQHTCRRSWLLLLLLRCCAVLPVALAPAGGCLACSAGHLLLLEAFVCSSGACPLGGQLD